VRGLRITVVLPCGAVGRSELDPWRLRVTGWEVEVAFQLGAWH
jgi:hypothetical protein